jgi:hypothetical protein
MEATQSADTEHYRDYSVRRYNMEATQLADTVHHRDYSFRRYNIWRLLSQQIQYIIEITHSEDTIYGGYSVSRYIALRSFKN